MTFTSLTYPPAPAQLTDSVTLARPCGTGIDVLLHGFRIAQLVTVTVAPVVWPEWGYIEPGGTGSGIGFIYPAAGVPDPPEADRAEAADWIRRIVFDNDQLTHWQVWRGLPGWLEHPPGSFEERWLASLAA